MTWKSMPPAEVCDVMDFWISLPWPLSRDEVQQRAVEHFGWTIEVENDTPYLMNTVSNLTAPDVMTVSSRGAMMHIQLDTTDNIREVTPESTAFLNDAFTLMVREGQARWGKPTVKRRGAGTTALWGVDGGARVSFRLLPQGVFAKYETPQGVEIDRRAGP